MPGVSMTVSSAHFGEDAVFMDVDTIEAGVDFVEVLQNAVQSCDVLVALIGRSWLNIKDEAGKRRLDNPEDFVRIEIAAALDRDIRVIPVLVDGVPMPRSTELPDNLIAFGAPQCFAGQSPLLQCRCPSFDLAVGIGTESGRRL